MQYKPIYRDISIVVVGDVSRDVCNPLYLFKHKVISQEELSSINDKDMRVGIDIVSFKTSAFELYCDSGRLQIRAEDSSRSDQLSDIVLNILRLSEITPKAIGINATFRFCMDESSYLKFCDKCSPIAAFTPMTDNALLVDLTFLDWERKRDDGSMTVYNIKRFPDDINNQRVIQMSVNNHLVIRDLDMVIRYLGETTNLHLLFFDRCQQFINNIK